MITLRNSLLLISLAALIVGHPPGPLAGRRDADVADLWVVRHDGGRPAEMVLAQTLQGLTGREKPRLWLERSGMSAVILEQLLNEGTRIHRVDSVWDLPKPFWQEIQGAIVYNLDTHSLNAAVSLCGPLHVVAIDASLLDQAKAHGLQVIYDARGQSEDQIFDNYGDLFSPGIALEQSETKPAYLRDFAVLNNAFCFYGLGSAFRRRVAQALGPGATFFGWTSSEYQWISDLSRTGASGVAADWCVNLSALAKLPVKIPCRPRRSPPAPAKEGERIVAFTLSDGDNLQWLTGSMPLDEKYFGSPWRGQFDMTWEVSPLLATLAPRVLKYFYDQATERDGFVAAGSPGYRYIHFEPEPRGELDAEQSAPYLRAAHLSIVSVINDNAGRLEEVTPLLERPEVSGVIYKSYAPYHRLRGQILWRQGKPAVAYKFVLWENLRGGSIQEVAAAIGQMPSSPQEDPGSYALINVHAWSFRSIGGPIEAVKRTLDILPPNTRVVTAEDFFTLLRDNFAPEK